MDEYFEHARREMLPKMRDAAFTIHMAAEPDPKLCMELGAAILFDKPILIVVQPGRPVPLALRTIAHRIVEIDLANPTPAARKQMEDAVSEMAEMTRFRGTQPPTTEDPDGQVRQ